MATLNASLWGFITTGNQTTHAAARGALNGTATSNPTTSQSSPIEYIRLSSRGRGSIYRINRTFYYFDTSGITDTVASATINIKGTTTANADVIVVPSTAFSGDGSTYLDNGDINKISFNTDYSDEYTGWTNNNSNNDIELKSQAKTDIQNDDYFICAVIQYDNDYLNTDPGSNGTFNDGINFVTTAYLEYITTSSLPSIDSLNGITLANLSAFNAVALTDIGQINGVDK